MSTDVRDAAPPRPRTGLVRVAVGLFLGTVGYMLPFSAASTVLLPARIADLDPEHKVGLLAVLTAVAAVAGLVANVVFGALSDRTRTRYGARTPWIVGGAMVTAVLMVPISRAAGFGELLAWWCLAAAALNATLATLSAILPDRVPVARRATVSAVIGVAILLGSALGAVTGAAFLDDTERGIQVSAVLLLVLTVSAVLVAPDSDNRHADGGALDVRVLAAAFRFPRGAPDFYWALWGRLLLVLGYFMINGFQLYIFTDYVGLDDEATARALSTNSVVFLVTALVGAGIAGPLSDRMQRRKVFVVGASLLATTAVSLPFFWASVGGMLGFATVGGLAFGVYYAVDAALMSEVLPSSESRARDLGILNVANTGGQVLAPAASSLLVGLGIGFAPVFLGAIVAGLVGAVFVWPIRSVR
jgi:MFS family permease